MIKENTGKFIILNEEIADPSRLPEILKNAERCVEKSCSGRMVYEVIRLIDGVPLFFEDHYERMRASYGAAFGDPAKGSETRAALAGPEDLRTILHRLAEANGQKNCNIKLIAFPDAARCSILGYVSKSFYPPAEMMNSGVPTELYCLERENPNIKLVDWDYKERIARIKADQQVFEVILLDRENRLTEGSSSNLFFVKDGGVYTAPGGRVLKGITRNYVIQACLDSGFPVREEFISVDDLDHAEGAFLSGTSINVLPIASIGSRTFASAKHPVIVKIRDTYGRLLQEYIDKHR